MNLKIFQNSEFGELRVLTIDGKEYFPATQCAKILGHENPVRAVRKYCKGVTETVTPTNGGNQSVKYIPEGDLYRLIIRSKLPAAEKFEHWVFDEVLPELRKKRIIRKQCKFGRGYFKNRNGSCYGSYEADYAGNK